MSKQIQGRLWKVKAPLGVIPRASASASSPAAAPSPDLRAQSTPLAASSWGEEGRESGDRRNSEGEESSEGNKPLALVVSAVDDVVIGLLRGT